MAICTSCIIRRKKDGSARGSNSSTILWVVCKVCFLDLAQQMRKVCVTITLLLCLRLTCTADRIITLVSDPARNCFYSLTANNTISIWRTHGDKHVQQLQTISNLYKAAQDKVPGSPALTPQIFNIIALHVIHPSESRAGVQLVAVTANGVRLYFSPSLYGVSYGWSSTPASGFRPLSLAHVRLPPPNLIHPDEQGLQFGEAGVGYGMGQAQQAPPRPHILSGLVHSCYDLGITIASQGADVADTDYILCMAPDLTQIGSLGQLRAPQVQQTSAQYTNPTYGAPAAPTRPPLTERATLISIPGLTWGIAPVPRSKYSLANSAPVNTPTPLAINELATQLSEPARQYIILNNGGLHWIVKRRAIDALKEVVEELQSEGNLQPLIEFRDRYYSPLSYRGLRADMHQLRPRSDLCNAASYRKRKHLHGTDGTVASRFNEPCERRPISCCQASLL